MKSNTIFIAGSRKFFDEIESFKQLCLYHKLNVFTPGKSLNDTSADAEHHALQKALSQIQECAYVYVFAPQGYIGKTVTLEIAFAFALNKEIISSDVLQDPLLASLVSKVLKDKAFIEYVNVQSR